jgi:hypothetical protein
MGDDDLTDWIAEDLWRATRYTGRRHWATGPAWLGLTEAEKRHWRRLAALLFAEPSPNRARLEVHRPLDASRSGESSCDSVVAEQAAEDCWHVYENGALVGHVRPWSPGPDWKLVDLQGGLLSTAQFNTPQRAARFYPSTKPDLT